MRTQRALEGLEGVKKVEASFENKTVRVIYDPQKVTVERLIATIEDLGYRASALP